MLGRLVAFVLSKHYAMILASYTLQTVADAASLLVAPRDKHAAAAQHIPVWVQGAVTGTSSGAQEDAVKAEAKVQDLQGRLKLAEQDKTASEKAQKVSLKLGQCMNWKGRGGVACTGLEWGTVYSGGVGGGGGGRGGASRHRSSRILA